LLHDVDAFEAVMARHDILGVLAGHSHQANSARFGGALYTTAPAVLCQLDFPGGDVIVPVQGSGFNLCRIERGKLIVQPVLVGC
jgi:hypothetical protein